MAKFAGKIRFILSSFNIISLLRFRALEAPLDMGLLVAPDLIWYLKSGLSIPFIRPQAIHPHYSMVNSELVQAAHAKGLQVNVWTVNGASEVRRLQDLGVDAIISDDPRRVSEALRN